MMLSLLAGGLDAPAGYDSGIKFLQYVEAPVYALEHNTNRLPMCPDIDHKINPEWKKHISMSPITRSFTLPDGLKLKWKKVKK